MRGRPTINSPPTPPRSLSFEIAGPQRRRIVVSAQAPRLDQVNSGYLIRQARQIYGRYLGSTGVGSGQPAGVILHGDGGRVVFAVPTLLPNEVFIPAEWLLGRTAATPAKASRPRPGNPWSTLQP